MDGYSNLLCAIIKKAADDAVKDDEPGDRRWLYSADARELCEMVNINYPEFQNAVLRKIKEHDTEEQEAIS